MSDSVDRVFVHALNTVKKIPRTGSARPPPADRLKLYGLYKQSMEGDVEGVMDRPTGSGDDVQAETEKWDSWRAQHGISRTEAKRRYITTLIATMHKYASPTLEARELVSELEFVWDQIKSNPSSSSSSSPLQSAHQQLHAQPSYASIGGSRTDIPPRPGVGNNPNRLRVLSPISQRDEEEMQRQRDEDEAGELGDTRNRDPETDMDNEIHNRKWRRRVEQALTKLTAEVAALREQMESTRSIYGHARRRSGLWAWMKWLVWVAIRQIVWDAVILAAVALCMRWKGDGRLEERMGVLWERIRGWFVKLARRIGRPKVLTVR